VISDADVRVPTDLLVNAVAPFRPYPVAADVSPRKLQNQISADSRRRLQEVGLINCFYRLANPMTLAMQWEAIAINADFWSQVLQSKTLKPLDFALGAVMITKRKYIDEIGGFESLENCLADDYQLGHRIAKKGHRIELCPVVVECWHSPQTWREVWKHQLRWARTIRVCQPVPYFFSILSNPTLWSLLWLLGSLPDTTITRTILTHTANVHAEMSIITVTWAAKSAIAFCVLRSLLAVDLQRLLTRSFSHLAFFWLAPLKDLLQALIWFCAFTGNTIEWRGQKFILRQDGTLQKK
jgi:ceramide glucosyltransferase